MDVKKGYKMDDFFIIIYYVILLLFLLLITYIYGDVCGHYSYIGYGMDFNAIYGFSRQDKYTYSSINYIYISITSK